MKKALVLFLTILTVLQCLPLTVFAETGTVPGAPETPPTVLPNIWYGDEVAYEVKAGTGSYTFMSYYKGPRAGYEASNHMVHPRGVDGGQEIPQLLVLLDATKDYTWTPDGLYSFGSSNYDVLYCCDIATGYGNGIYYRRLNLEDSDYYDAESARHIRGILTNSYPYITVEQMKSNLIAAGLPNADKLTRSDIIAGVQTAVWAFANGGEDEIFTDYVYYRTADFPSNPQWGGILHNYNNEMRPVWWPEKKYAVIYPHQSEEAKAAGERVDSLVEYLKNAAPREASADQVIISGMEILDSVPVFENENIYTTIVRVKLNSSGSGQNDNLDLGIYVDGQLVQSRKVEYGNTVYEFVVRAAAGQTIKAVASGTQILPTGVYFYEALGGRKASQSLVGLSGGPTDVYAEAEVTLNVDPVPVKADIHLAKVTDTGMPLTGAGFDLYVTSASTPTLIGSYKVDASGKLTVKDLLPGTYELTETVVPAGYVPPKDPLRFTVDNKGAVILHQSSNASYVDGTFVVRNDPFCAIPVQKVWSDGGNFANNRPASITVHLLADGVRTGMKVTLSAQNNWSAVFSNLEYYRDGVQIRYTVEEEVPAGYMSFVSGTAETGYTITNVPHVDRINIPVAKFWDDNNNAAGVRPASVTVALYANGMDTKRRATLSEKNNWSATFSGMPVQVNGFFFNYTVKEVPVDGYVSHVIGSASGGYIIVNTYTPPEKTFVSGVKFWNDSDNRDGIRPESITVHLLADGAVVQSKTVTAADDWSWNFSDLPATRQGRTIRYTVAEESIPGYTSAVNGYNITNTHIPEKISIPVRKVWADADNKDGLRPASVVISLLADGKKTGRQITLSAQNGWSGSFTDLDKCLGGKEIRYTVEEAVPAGYESSVTGSAESGYTVTNIHNPPKKITKISVSVTKSWQDANNRDGIRPASITVKLYADGKDTGRTAQLSAASGWSASFTDLDETKDGKKIAYTVAEVTPDGYTSTVTGSAADGFHITNTHDPEKVRISGSKSWEDNNNRAGKRPASISVHLWADDKLVETKRVSAADGWAWSFSEMNAFENGKRINYRVTESAVDGYITSYNGWNIVNTLEEEKLISIPVSKRWVDLDNALGTRPASITVELLANGKSTGISVTLGAAGGWSSSFDKLPIFDENGKRITYSVAEQSVESYTAEISGNAESGFAIVNTYEELFDDEEIPLSPPTGDAILALTAASVLSACAVKCIARKKKDDSDEE